MADSTADSTAENADTLRQKLKTILTESFYEGGINLNEIDDGGSRVLEAIEILISLRKLESGIEENADNLRKQLKKILTESIYNIDLNTTDDDGSSGILKEKIDESIGILTRLRKEESENQEFDVPRVLVPKHFKCLFTNQIMIDPVIVASGQV